MKKIQKLTIDEVNAALQAIMQAVEELRKRVETLEENQ